VTKDESVAYVTYTKVLKKAKGEALDDDKAECFVQALLQSPVQFYQGLGKQVSGQLRLAESRGDKVMTLEDVVSFALALEVGKPSVAKSAIVQAASTDDDGTAEIAFGVMIGHGSKNGPGCNICKLQGLLVDHSWRDPRYHTEAQRESYLALSKRPRADERLAQVANPKSGGNGGGGGHKGNSNKSKGNKGNGNRRFRKSNDKFSQARVDGNYEKRDSDTVKSHFTKGNGKGDSTGKGQSKRQLKWHGARSGGATEAGSSGSASESSEERALVTWDSSRSGSGRGSSSGIETWEIENMPDEELEQQIYALRLFREARRRRNAGAQGRESS
jgi:hypothetical protein